VAFSTPKVKYYSEWGANNPYIQKLLFPGEECLVVCGIMEHTLLEHGEDDRSNLLKYPTAQITLGSHIVGYIDIKGFIDDEKEMPFPLRDAYNNG